MNHKRQEIIEKVSLLKHPFDKNDVYELSKKLVNHKPLILKLLNCRDQNIMYIYIQTSHVQFKKYVEHMLGYKSYFISNINLGYLYYVCSGSPQLLDRKPKSIINYTGEFINNCIANNIEPHIKYVKYSVKYHETSERHLFGDYPDPDCLYLTFDRPKILIILASKYDKLVTVEVKNLIAKVQTGSYLSYTQLSIRKRKTNIEMIDSRGNLMEKLILLTLRKFTTKNMTKLVTYFM